MTATQDKIEKVVELRATPARVWKALTDHQEFGAWFQVAMDDPFVAGETSRGVTTHPDCKGAEFVVHVQTMEPERRFSFTWHPAAIDPQVDYSEEPTTLVEFRLEPAPGGTRLTITESGFAALPDGRRWEALRENTKGWDHQAERIRDYVESGAS